MGRHGDLPLQMTACKIMTLQKSSSLKSLKVKKLKIAIVMSRFNEAISRALLKGAITGLLESGVAEKDIGVVEVPGAFEIPLTALTAARSKKFNAIVCLGAIIRGQTPHFDYVCQAATQGILRAQLETGLPMAFGILTTNTIDEALARARPGRENKGYEAAKVVIEMVEVVKKLKKKNSAI